MGVVAIFEDPVYLFEVSKYFNQRIVASPDFTDQGLVASSLASQSRISSTSF